MDVVPARGGVGQAFTQPATVAFIPALVAAGGGAGRQREVYELSGIDALLRELTAATGQLSGIIQT